MEDTTTQNGRNPLRTALVLGLHIPLLWYQGCMGTHRGLPVLIEAMPLIREKEPLLIFLGNGSELTLLQNLAAEKGWGERVFFHPAVPPRNLLSWTRDATGAS